MDRGYWCSIRAGVAIVIRSVEHRTGITRFMNEKGPVLRIFYPYPFATAKFTVHIPHSDCFQVRFAPKRACAFVRRPRSLKTNTRVLGTVECTLLWLVRGEPYSLGHVPWFGSVLRIQILQNISIRCVRIYC